MPILTRRRRENPRPIRSSRVQLSCAVLSFVAAAVVGGLHTHDLRRFDSQIDSIYPLFNALYKSDHVEYLDPASGQLTTVRVNSVITEGNLEWLRWLRDAGGESCHDFAVTLKGQLFGECGAVWRTPPFNKWAMRDEIAGHQASIGWGLAVIGIALLIHPLYLALRGRRRRTQGLCVVCGYDCRATRSRCPECGTMRPESSVGGAEDVGDGANE